LEAMKVAAAEAARAAAVAESDADTPPKVKKKKKKKKGKKKGKKGSKSRHGTDATAATAATLPVALSLRQSTAAAGQTNKFVERKKSLTKQFTLTRPRDAAGNPIEAPVSSKGLNKSKSMGSFYFRSGRKGSAGNPMPVRSHEHTPRLGRPSNSNSIGMDEASGPSKRDTIRRGEQGSYTDLTMLVKREREGTDVETSSTHGSRKTHSRSRTEGSKGSKSKSRSGAGSHKSGGSSSKRKSGSRRSSRSSSSASSAEENERLRQEKEAEMLQSLLSRIASKYGHALSELEGLVAEVKK
jgi:hypothetical protein